MLRDYSLSLILVAVLLVLYTAMVLYSRRDAESYVRGTAAVKEETDRPIQPATEATAAAATAP